MFYLVALARPARPKKVQISVSVGSSSAFVVVVQQTHLWRDLPGPLMQPPGIGHGPAACQRQMDERQKDLGSLEKSLESPLASAAQDLMFPPQVQPSAAEASAAGMDSPCPATAGWLLAVSCRRRISEFHRAEEPVPWTSGEFSAVAAAVLLVLCSGLHPTMVPGQ